MHVCVCVCVPGTGSAGDLLHQGLAGELLRAAGEELGGVAGALSHDGPVAGCIMVGVPWA